METFSMKRLGMAAGAALLGIVMSSAAWAAGDHATVTGYVIDSACTFTHNLNKPVSSECAVTCAKAGSPLVILSDDGIVYWPIGATMPAKSQNERLIPYAGKRVIVNGTVYSKGGSRAVVIERIEAEPARK